MNIQKEMGIHHTLEDYFQKLLHDYYASKDPIQMKQAIAKLNKKQKMKFMLELYTSVRNADNFAVFNELFIQLSQI
jgi:hypothetical protein